MKKILVISSLGLSLILGVIFLTPTFNLARAGVEPSPFQPEINQLGAVANILNSADFRVVKTMSVPPDPCTPPDPCKGLNGDVNRLEAINNQVSSADNMVASMINEVMGFEPMPFRPEVGDLVLPLEVVKEAAQGIVYKIEDFMRISGGSSAPEFTEALGQVSDSAIRLIGTADDGIVLFSGGTLECGEIDDAEVCRLTSECYWDDAGYCVAES